MFGPARKRPDPKQDGNVPDAGQGGQPSGDRREVEIQPVDFVGLGSLRSGETNAYYAGRRWRQLRCDGSAAQAEWGSISHFVFGSEGSYLHRRCAPRRHTAERNATERRNKPATHGKRRRATDWRRPDDVCVRWSDNTERLYNDISSSERTHSAPSS